MDLINPVIHLAAIVALEEAEILAQQRGPRFHHYKNPFTDSTDVEFKRLYRLTKPLTSELIELLEPHMVAPTRMSALSVKRKIFLSKWYALRPWLLTPITNAQPGTPEAAYNEAHRSIRALIERCNEVLKLRFRCLLKHRVLHYAPEKSSKIINACTVLHNLCVANNVPPLQLGEDEDDGNLEIDYGMYDDGEISENRVLAARANPDLVAGRQLRNRVIRNHFNF